MWLVILAILANNVMINKISTHKVRLHSWVWHDSEYTKCECIKILKLVGAINNGLKVY